MTIEQLIEELAKFPPASNVICWIRNSSEHFNIHKVDQEPTRDLDVIILLGT